MEKQDTLKVLLAIKDVELDGCKDDFISFLTAFPHILIMD